MVMATGLSKGDEDTQRHRADGVRTGRGAAWAPFVGCEKFADAHLAQEGAARPFHRT
jgi:hypothetical protein